MFNEQSHAFIAAMYYNKLKERFGDTGVAAFTHATQQYGLQRGHRMALKALRDGKPLDIFSYREYGELIRTADAPETILEVESTSPDYVYRITACPWHMGSAGRSQRCFRCSFISRATGTVWRKHPNKLLRQPQLSLREAAAVVFYAGFPEKKRENPGKLWYDNKKRAGKEKGAAAWTNRIF